MYVQNVRFQEVSKTEVKRSDQTNGSNTYQSVIGQYSGRPCPNADESSEGNRRRQRGGRRKRSGPMELTTANLATATVTRVVDGVGRNRAGMGSSVTVGGSRGPGARRRVSTGKGTGSTELATVKIPGWSAAGSMTVVRRNSARKVENAGGDNSGRPSIWSGEGPGR